MGGVPAGVELSVWPGSGPLPPDAEGTEFYVPPFLAAGEPVEVLHRLPRLRVVQLLTAGSDAVEEFVPAGVTLCNARGVHDPSTAEWVVSAMLGSLHDFPTFALAQAAGRWAHATTDTLFGKTVLLVGAGSIARAVERRLAGFEVEIRRVARRARDGVEGVDALPRLLPTAAVVVILLPLTPATTGFVDAEFLAAMPDGALLVNAARGPVVVTAALLAELQAGRLHAALDVTDPEPLPSGHPLWTAPGLLLTPHVAGSTPLALPRGYALVRAQLEHVVRGEPLQNVVTHGN